MGAGGEDLLRLTEQPGAHRISGTTGLYHTAFMVPTRCELAQLLRQIAETRTPIQGMSNHGTHNAIYLPGAESNGIELAWDFPPDVWPQNAQEMLARNRGLSPQEVFRHLKDNPEPWTGLYPGTKVGHVHLNVSQLEPTRRFYSEVLGFATPFELGIRRSWWVLPPHRDQYLARDRCATTRKRDWAAAFYGHRAG